MNKLKRTIKRLARIRKFFASFGEEFDIGNLDF